MSITYRHITRREGITAPELAKATGLPLPAVRAELNALLAEGKLVCQRAERPGQPHRWWRVGRRPLDNLSVLVVAASAARIHSARGKLRDVLRGLADRAADPVLAQVVALAAGSKAPHAIVAEALNNYYAAGAADMGRK